MSDGSTGVIDRLKSLVGWGRESKTVRDGHGGGHPDCTHNTRDIEPGDGESIWLLQDSYLRGEPYWTHADAAFQKCRERVKEWKCIGCGQERTITTGEPIETVWKEDLDADEIAQFHEEVWSGGWFNGKLWWEHKVWDGDVADVATERQWKSDHGYTEWKDDDERSLQTATEHEGGEDSGGE